MASSGTGMPAFARLVHEAGIELLTYVYPRTEMNAALAESGRTSVRRRSLPADLTGYLAVALPLHRGESQTAVLENLGEGLWAMTGRAPPPMPSGAAITLARQRLGTEPLAALHRRCVRPLATPDTLGSWFRGYRLLALDGSSLSVPDTPANAEAFGRPGSRRRPAAFPRLRLTALVEVGTHAVLAWRHGPWRQSESRQAQDLMAELGPGQLVLADRYYCGYPLWSKALATGAALLWRARDRMHFPVLRRHPDGSYDSEIAPPRSARRSARPVPVRVIEYTLPAAPGRVYRLLTNLTPAQAPAAELAALYRERWEVEHVLREIKSQLLTPGAGAALRGRTPTLVHQELQGLMLGHYAIRALMHEAAARSGEDPDRLSFARALRIVRRRLQSPGAFSPWGDQQRVRAHGGADPEEVEP